MQHYYAYFSLSICHYKIGMQNKQSRGFLESFSPQVKHPRTWRENRIIFVFVNRQTETVTITLEHNN